jgi:hypothetical protein
MNSKVFRIFITAVLFIPGNISAARLEIKNPISLSATNSIYVVRSGETFSDVVWRALGSPLYGSSGWLAKIRLQNPQIKDIHKILPGQQIQFGEAAHRSISSVKEVQVAELAASSSEAKLEIETVSELPQMTPESNATEKVKDTPPPLPSTFKPVSQLKVMTGVEYFRLDVRDTETGGKSILLSNMSPAVKLSWDLQWNERWSSFVDLMGVNYRVLDVATSSSSRTMFDSSGSRFGVGVGALRRWGETSRASFRIGYDEKVFSHSSSLTSLTVDRVGTPTATITQENDLLAVSTAKLGIAVGLQSMLPSIGVGYNTKVGFGGSVSSYLSHQLQNFALSGQLILGYEQQNSTIFDQTRTELSFLLGASWRFDK